MKRTLVAAFVAASLTVPVSNAEAGFLRSVVKGTVNNSLRHTKKTARRVVQTTSIMSRCTLLAVTGRRC
ncbi:MAG: hypothetical protein AB7E80_13750 [Hyphomicrobiaceae bacterium]